MIRLTDVEVVHVGLGRRTLRCLQGDNVVALSVADNPVGALHVMNAARALRRLQQHDCRRVPQLLFVGRVDGWPAVASRWIHGSSLLETVNARGVVCSIIAAEWGHSLREAFRDVHAAGIVHRDVTPANIIVGSDGQLYVIDFGLSVFKGCLPVSGTCHRLFSVLVTAVPCIEQDLASLDRCLTYATLGHRAFCHRVVFQSLSVNTTQGGNTCSEKVA